MNRILSGMAGDVFIGNCVSLWKKMRGKRRRKNHQHEPMGKKYEYTMPGQVHRGYIHPGKPEIPLDLCFVTVCILCLLLGREFINLCFGSISEAKDSWEESGGRKESAFTHF